MRDAAPTRALRCCAHSAAPPLRLSSAPRGLRCPSPRADEAFKRVGLAFYTLRDPQERAAYDRYGWRGGGGAGAAAGGGGSGGGGGFGGGRRGGFTRDVDAEELFRAFFGADGPGAGFGGFGGFGGGGGGGAGGRPPSASLRAADERLRRAVGPTAAAYLAMGRRLGETFYRNPWTLVTAITALLSAVQILESLAGMLGLWTLAALPAAAVGLAHCPARHRRSLGMLALMLLMSGALL